MAKFRIDYAEVEVNIDDYNEGELDYVNSWDVDVKGNTYNSLKELIKGVARNSYVFSENPSDWVYIDGRLDTDALVNNDNEEPDDDELEGWKKGEVTLYNAHVMVGVSVISEEHELTEEEAEEQGINIY